MDKDTIDLDRVVHDPEYRRLVIERLKARAAVDAAAPTGSRPANGGAAQGRRPGADIDRGAVARR